MLKLASDKQIKTWANPSPLTKVNDVLIQFEKGAPRYRFVLVNEKHAEMPKDDITPLKNQS